VTTSDKTLLFLFLLHCERIKSEGHGLNGPENLDFSQKSILGIADYLEEQGYRCDFHPVPDLAKAQSGLFVQLKRRGFGIGMHFHCESWREGERNRPLSTYPAEEQRRILAEATGDFSQAMGFSPTSYSAGNFSMSDDTYGILAELGFKQASTSVPERFVPRFGANWLGKFPFPHLANCQSRLIPGDLDLVEFPTACHPTRRADGINPIDARLDCAHSESTRKGKDLIVEPEFYEQLVRLNCHRILHSDWPAKVLTVFSHNLFDFADRNIDQRKNLETVVEEVKKQAEEYGCPLAVTTMEDTRRSICWQVSTCRHVAPPL